ncbi:tyrosine-type recombinase/integrase [Aureimonas glaciei]|uniref:Integrase n=1 Tax=Aureimonas glaciei TaxID=1776957 RepID=A0A916YF54_9HYPH|nr:tyrosine-type recombinase/integrase [Aureimonas glaciei]GGD42455.1 integrase [Aureimonas glaciei]
MRVRLKGLNSKRKTLADGSVVTYFYAWKGGPRIEGKPGSPEFMAAYNAAVARKLPATTNVIHGLLRKFQESSDFTGLAKRTRQDYVGKVLLIEKEFGDFPLAALGDKRTRNLFMEWRDRLAKSSPRQADLAWTVLARVLSWSLNRGLIDVNPCKAGGRLYDGGTRREITWSADQEDIFLRHASGGIRLAFLLAINTGQRQGDLLRLPWSAYDGTSIRLKQSKTGARVRVPVTSALKAALDTSKRVSPIILTTRGGTPFTEDGFRSSWRKTREKAGVEGVTFHDLRGTAVTRLFIAGCTDAEVATITGHSLGEVRSILDANYFSRDYALAESGIAKLEARTKIPDRAPDQPTRSNEQGEKQ